MKKDAKAVADFNSPLSQFSDSMLHDSDTWVAGMEYKQGGHEIDVTLMVRGKVSVTYKGRTFRKPSLFPGELKKLIRTDRNWTSHPDVYVRNNNWYEFIYEHSCEEYFCMDGIMFEQFPADVPENELEQRMKTICEDLIKNYEEDKNHEANH